MKRFESRSTPEPLKLRVFVLDIHSKVLSVKIDLKVRGKDFRT